MSTTSKSGVFRFLNKQNINRSLDQYRILYESKQILAFEKPANVGWHSKHPGQPGLSNQLKSFTSASVKTLIPGPKLPNDVSGVQILFKKPEYADTFKEMIEDDIVSFVILVAACGKLKKEQGVITVPFRIVKPSNSSVVKNNYEENVDKIFNPKSNYIGKKYVLCPDFNSLIKISEDLLPDDILYYDVKFLRSDINWAYRTRKHDCTLVKFKMKKPLIDLVSLYTSKVLGLPIIGDKMYDKFASNDYTNPLFHVYKKLGFNPKWGIESIPLHVHLHKIILHSGFDGEKVEIECPFPLHLKYTLSTLGFSQHRPSEVITE